MTFEKVNLTDYFEIVGPGVKLFKGSKKYIATGSMENGKITGFDEVDYEGRPSRANMEALENDIMFAKMKDTEKVFVVSKETADNIYSTGFSILRIKDNKQFHPKFIFYWLRSKEFQAMKNKECTGATQKALNETKLKTFRVPKPPLETQCRIATLLGKVEGLKEKRTESNRLMKEFLRSIFFSKFKIYFNDPKYLKTCDEICDNITVGIVFQPAKYYAKTGIPALRSLNVRENAVSLENLVYFSEEDNNTVLKNTRLRAKDIVIVRSGYPGTAAVIPDSLSGINCIDLLIARPKNNVVLSDYLAFLLNMPISRNQILQAQHGMAQQHYNVGSLRKLKVAVPPLKEQTEFAHLIQVLSNLQTDQQTSDTEISSLFVTLMHNAFNNES